MHIQTLGMLLIAAQIILESMPISSSAHVLIIKKLYSVFWSKHEFFSAAIYQLSNIPMLIITAIFFRKALLQAIPLKKQNGSWALDEKILHNSVANIVFASLSSLITITIYLLFRPVFMRAAHPLVIAPALLITALSLYSLRWVPVGSTRTQLTLQDSIIIGLGQSLCLFPGLSRLANTFVVARWLCIQDLCALHYSFLMHAMLNVALLGKFFYCERQQLLPIALKLINLPLLLIIATTSVLSYLLLMLTTKMMRQNQWWMFSCYLPIPAMITLFLWYKRL